MPPVNCSFSAFIQANPFARYFFTKSVKSSIFFREYLLPPGTTSPLTISADLKALNSDWSVNVFISCKNKSKRVSGLSEPYLSMASSQVNLGKGSGKSTSITFLNM